MENKVILLVVDNPDDELLTLRELEKNHIMNEVEIVRDGAEALDYLFGTGVYSDRDIRSIPQFVLLNLNIPKIDGLEVLRRLRNDERTKLLPVVVFTSSEEEIDLVESCGLGTNSYIRKPLDFTQFAEAIKQLNLGWFVLNETNFSGKTPIETEKTIATTSADDKPPLPEISSMEDEDNILVKNEVAARLSELISNMTEAEIRELIEEIEKRQKAKPIEYRKHPRKPSKIAVDFSIDDFPFTQLIKNISNGGAFIETELPFLTDKELLMTFNMPGYENPIKISGKIVRTDSKGIGVQFDDLLPDI